MGLLEVVGQQLSHISILKNSSFDLIQLPRTNDRSDIGANQAPQWRRF
jgi:hypothetical protein